ncbi:MAG: hypothetical protein GQ557_01370 [Mycoplasmataceae bacterium]|nr:hypothetical protein [Mycoplasmataceae bacterium]
MTKLDKMNLDRMNSNVDEYVEEKQLRSKLNDIYQEMLDESPSLKYILKTWISDNDDKIKECDVSIQFLSKEIKNFHLMVDIKN